METLFADFMKYVAKLKVQVAVNYRAFRNCECPLGIESSFQLTEESLDPSVIQP